MPKHLTLSTFDCADYHRAMTPKADALSESRELATMLVMVAERMKGDFARSVEPSGVPVAVARALLLLEEPAPMRALADQLACDQSYVTGLADDLENLGLATREPGEDRRVKVLTPTKAGVALRTKIAKAVSEDSLVLTRLDETDRRELHRLLALLLQDVN